MTAEELIGQLENDSMARLRWLVLSKFGVLPGSRRAGELSDGECLRCAAHMVLDRRQGEQSAEARSESGSGGSFDEERFLRLKGERT